MAPAVKSKRGFRGLNAYGFKRRWPFLIWLLAVAVFVFLLEFMHGGITLSGVVMKERITVTAPLDGRIDRILVEAGDQVTSGQPLFQLDTSGILAGMEAEHSSLEREKERVIRGRLQARADQVRLQQERDRIRLEASSSLASIRQQAAGIKAELAGVSEEIARMEPLVAQHLADAVSLAEKKTTLNRLQAELAAIPDMIAAQEASRSWASEPVDLPIHDNGGEEPSRDALALLKQQLRDCAVNATTTGAVGQVLVSEGQTVPLGTPIMEIISPSCHRVLALLPEERVRSVTVGMEFVVQGARNADLRAKGTVRDILPDVVGLDQRGMLIPQRVKRGRYVLLSLNEERPFLPGESVIVRYEQSGWSSFRSQVRKWIR